MNLVPFAPSPILCLSRLFLLLLPLIEFVNEVNPTSWQRFMQNDIKALLQRRTQSRCNGWLLHLSPPAA